jgi:hypothetical protein
MCLARVVSISGPLDFYLSEQSDEFEFHTTFKADIQTGFNGLYFPLFFSWDS